MGSGWDLIHTDRNPKYRPVITTKTNKNSRILFLTGWESYREILIPQTPRPKSPWSRVLDKSGVGTGTTSSLWLWGLPESSLESSFSKRDWKRGGQRVSIRGDFDRYLWS